MRHTIGVVVCGSGVQWPSGDRRSDGGGPIDSTRGGCSTRVWAVVGGRVVTVLRNDLWRVSGGCREGGSDLRVRAKTGQGDLRSWCSKHCWRHCQEDSNIGATRHEERLAGNSWEQQASERTEKGKTRDKYLFGGMKSSSVITVLFFEDFPPNAGRKQLPPRSFLISSSEDQNHILWVFQLAYAALAG